MNLLVIVLTIVCTDLTKKLLFSGLFIDFLVNILFDSVCAKNIFLYFIRDFIKTKCILNFIEINLVLLNCFHVINDNSMNNVHRLINVHICDFRNQILVGLFQEPLLYQSDFIEVRAVFIVPAVYCHVF